MDAENHSQPKMSNISSGTFFTISPTGVFTRVPPPQPRVPIVPEPKDGIYKPNRYTDEYWPAVRARNFVKEVNKEYPRMTYHNNLLYLANRCGITIAEFIKTHPFDIAKRLGIPKQRVTQMIGIHY
jgi:hypothetical protein